MIFPFFFVSLLVFVLLEVKGKQKVLCIPKRIQRTRKLSRGTTSVRCHLTMATFQVRTIPLFCNGNSRCSLLRMYPIQYTANRMNSRRTPPLSRTNRQLSLSSFQPTGFCFSLLIHELYHSNALKSIAFKKIFTFSWWIVIIKMKRKNENIEMFSFFA